MDSDGSVKVTISEMFYNHWVTRTQIHFIHTPLLSPKLDEDPDDSPVESDSMEEADKGGEIGEQGEDGGVTNLSSLLLDNDKQLISLPNVWEFAMSWDCTSILFTSNSLKSKWDNPIDSHILEKIITNTLSFVKFNFRIWFSEKSKREN